MSKACNADKVMDEEESECELQFVKVQHSRSSQNSAYLRIDPAYEATHGFPSLRRSCTVGIDRNPPACSRDVTAEWQPFVVGEVLKSCGRGRGHHGERCVHSVNC